MHRSRVSNVALIAIVTLVLTSCKAFNYLDRSRTMSMSCVTKNDSWMNAAAAIFDQNGYTVIERNNEEGVIVAQDSIDQVEYRYTMLVRTWRVQHQNDSVFVDVYSVSTRMDGSDVTQTWDKKWSGEQVKSWMRPILTSFESACGLGSPLTPTTR
ncbi:MAG: hypothetical protein NTX15_00485 [Candidatus Kapabacteria bacterium]|nr:hypothetical protein [Candidatus Kapabacteria bacterium]